MKGSPKRAAPRKTKVEPVGEDQAFAEELKIQPIYRRDSPTWGTAGHEEIYRHGDRGFVVDVDLRKVAGAPFCTIRPVRFMGVEVTSYVQTGPDETLPDEDSLKAKLKREFA